MERVFIFMGAKLRVSFYGFRKCGEKRKITVTTIGKIHVPFSPSSDVAGLSVVSFPFSIRSLQRNAPSRRDDTELCNANFAHNVGMFFALFFFLFCFFFLLSCAASRRPGALSSRLILAFSTHLSGQMLRYSRTVLKLHSPSPFQGQFYIRGESITSHTFSYLIGTVAMPSNGTVKEIGTTAAR